MNRAKIYFRADGHAKMGLGHVIRSLALASMLREEYECVFFIQNPLPVLKKQILEVCQECIVLPEEKELLNEAQYLLREYLQPADIIVLDGYHFSTDYQIILKDTGAKVVCIDDIHSYHFVADAVINHAPGLKSEQYSLEIYSQLHLGLNYSLLRPAFLEAAQINRSFQKMDTAFICFGGSDMNNLSLTVLKALTKQPWVKKIHIVLGGANQNQESILNFSDSLDRPEVQIHRNLSAPEMVRVMQDSHLAIVPASSILYEVLAVNMIVLSGYYVENQIGVYHGFLELDLIRGVGDFNTFAGYQEVFDQIKDLPVEKMLQKQRSYIYGQSGRYFSQMFHQLTRSSIDRMSHRPARAADLMLYFDWANDPGVRQQSLTRASIPLESHQQWFLSKLESDSSRLYLFFADSQPIGQVRFELEGARAVINYSLATEARGKGYGKKMLSRAMELLQEDPDFKVQEFYGIVKKENIPSKKVFERLHFEVKEEKLIQGVPCLVYGKGLTAFST